MANLTYNEKQILEKLFGMEGGYVLNFSNNTFGTFFQEELNVNIYDPKYMQASGSKANCLRGFWNQESDDKVGFSIFRLIDYINNQIMLENLQKKDFSSELIDAGKRIAEKLTGMQYQKAEVKLQVSYTKGDITISLQKEIFDQVKSYLNDGYYFNAVEEAYKIVRKKLKEITGKEKATDAFTESNYLKIFGHLPINEVEKDFFEGVKFLNMAVQFLRNEKAHTPAYEIDHNLALHYISLASLAYELIIKNEING